ncbi:MAG: OsmC family protein [Chloroflexi bacterium]|nr:OsmC family protein [Chloroflexota bacterium]
MDAKVTWSQGMSFTGTAGTGFSVQLGADPGVGGANDGFRPMELMAVSLAGCTAMDVISIIRKKQQDVTGFEVQVKASQSESHPHVFQQAQILYQVSGHGVDESAVLRAIELSALKYCPAQAMLSKVIPITLHYELYEDKGGGTRELVKQGQWTPPAA